MHILNLQKDSIALQNILDVTFSNIRDYCMQCGSRIYHLGILSIENLAIVEQNTGSSVMKYLEYKVLNAFKSNNRNEFYLKKLDYNRYIFVIVYENNHSNTRVIEDILLHINQSEDKHNMSGNIFFLGKVGLTEYSNNADLGKAFNQSQCALFECKYGKNVNISIYNNSLSSIQNHVNYTDLLAMYVQNKDDGRIKTELHPIVDSINRKVAFYECSLKIVNKDGIKISTLPHIEAANKYGLTSDIDKLTLVEATKLLKQYKDISIALSVSACTIVDHDFLELAKGLFYKQDFFDRLIISITETMIINDFNKTKFFIKQLKDLGCNISLDNFRFGCSSHTQLSNIDISSVKIDSGYRKDMYIHKNSLSFIKSIINLARELNFKIIAQHVDDENAAKIITNLGVNYLQGKLFS